MRYFLRKLVIFWSPFIVIGVLLFSILTNYISNKVGEYKIEDSINTLFVGDSHVEVAINDKIYKNSKNIASSSEALYYSYFKLKKILNFNSNIHSVYLGFSYHNISNYYDDVIYGDKSLFIAPKYFAIGQVQFSV